MTPNHYTVAVFNQAGEKVKGFDYRLLRDAEAKRTQLERAGHRVEVWPMNIYGERLDREVVAA